MMLDSLLRCYKFKIEYSLLASIHYCNGFGPWSSMKVQSAKRRGEHFNGSQHMHLHAHKLCGAHELCTRVEPCDWSAGAQGVTTMLGLSLQVRRHTSVTPMLKTLKERYFPGLFGVLGRRVLLSTVRTTFKQLHDSNPLQYVYWQTVDYLTDAHRVTAADGREDLPSHETCSHAVVTVEDSRPAGSCFNIRIWLEDQRRDDLS